MYTSKHFISNLLIILFVLTGCSQRPASLPHYTAKPEPVNHPQWAEEAIWYQIFPERFRNGDPSNDPTIPTLTGTWPYDQQTYWDIAPWTADWYRPHPWEEANERGFYYNAQLRRYGGDLQGIIDQLDYLKDLGINAIYLNPIFESPSSHKYGCTYYHHIDNNFGPDPAGDELIWAQENHGDPTTWQWTAADRLFLNLIEEVHNRDMRIIIDGVFNHVGIPFWALQDVRINGPESPYAEWFTINRWDDPNTPEDEFDYEGWFGIRDLPELKENQHGLIAPIQEHIQAVVQRWMDPDGNGDPSDGIDGWRLDVAEKVSINFWREFRDWVTAVNPDAYITGEVWWEDYTKLKMFNARPWLRGDVFHSVMNYRFGAAAYQFFIFEKDQISASEFSFLLQEVIDQYTYDVVLGIQNLIGSHDNERIASACVNPDRFIDHDSNLNYAPDYQVRKPNSDERKIQKAMLAFQFMHPGSPYIYYGDEVGMWGADDPDERKPMVWSDMRFEPETHHPFGEDRPRDVVEVDQDLFGFYKGVIRLRQVHPALQKGSYRVLMADDERQIIVVERQLEDDHVIGIFNGSAQKQSFTLDEVGFDPAEWTIRLSNATGNGVTKLYTEKEFRIYVR